LYKQYYSVLVQNTTAVGGEDLLGDKKAIAGLEFKQGCTDNSLIGVTRPDAPPPSGWGFDLS
jgi:hypothetical protein